MDKPKLFSKINVICMRDMIEFLEGQRSRLKCSSSNGGEVVLDIGCGPGDMTSKLSMIFLPLGTKVIGCDISKMMLDYAVATYACENLNFRYMDILGRDIWEHWEKGCCDKILSNYLLHWLQDHRLAINNMYSLLKDGGRLLITFIVEHAFLKALEKVAKMIQFVGYTKDIVYFKTHQCQDDRVVEKEYNEILKEAGFNKVDLRIVRKSFSWPNEESLIEAVMGFDPYVKHIPDNLKKIYKDELKNVIFEDKNVSIEPLSDCVRIDYRLMEIFAEK